MKSSVPWDLSVGNDEGVEVEGGKKKERKKKRRNERKKETKRHR